MNLLQSEVQALRNEIDPLRRAGSELLLEVELLIFHRHNRSEETEGSFLHLLVRVMQTLEELVIRTRLEEEDLWNGHHSPAQQGQKVVLVPLVV